MDGEDNNNDNIIKEESRCFVCDDEVQGRYYTLATCKTQNSQTRVIQKLGELVGERYMFVISEDDVICRSCAILINTFDRLEIEMRNIRDHVLRFIKLKYALTDGDLQDNNNRPKPCQPPQITRSNMREITSYCTEQSEVDLETYSKNKKMQKTSHSWLQCDKCKYTTQSNSFMMYHSRDYLKQKMFCDKCDMCIPANQKNEIHNCIGITDLENKENEKDNSSIIIKNDSMESSLLQTIMQPTSLSVTPSPLIGLSNCDHLYISNLLSVTPNTPTSSKSAIYVLQQDVDIIDTDGLNKMTRSESNIQETEIKTEREDKRQTLTLTEDGSLEIVEMACWNKM